MGLSGSWFSSCVTIMLRKSVGVRLRAGFVVVPAAVVELAGNIEDNALLGMVDMVNVSAGKKRLDQ